MAKAKRLIAATAVAVSDPGARDTASLVRTARNRHASLQEQQLAFAELVRRYEGMAFSAAMALSNDVEHARDSCQAAFLEAWRRLADLRDAGAFGAWVKRIVRTQCARARRRRNASTRNPDFIARLCEPATDDDTLERVVRHELTRTIRNAVDSLPREERDAVVLFYFLGETLKGVARAMRISEGAAGKKIYSARLRLRRELPRGIAESFLAVRPSASFTRKVQRGVFDEFTGTYRFAKRPAHPVVIERRGDTLIASGGGQTNVLASTRNDTLVPTEFDGSGSFHRDAGGRITHFVYYEFGRRIGVAQKT